jgi:hypothetical protein
MAIHIRRRAGQRRYPSHEAALELLSVEGRKNIAEVIVRRRSNVSLVALGLLPSGP